MRFLRRGRFSTRPGSQETMFRIHHVLSAAARRCDITDLVWAGGGGSAKCCLVQMALPSVSWKHHIPKLTFSGFSLQDYLSPTRISLDRPHTCHHTNVFFSPISDFTCVNKDIGSMTTNHFLTIQQICFLRAWFSNNTCSVHFWRHPHTHTHTDFDHKKRSSRWKYSKKDWILLCFH